MEALIETLIEALKNISDSVRFMNQSITDLRKIVVSQGELIKKLDDRVNSLSRESNNSKAQSINI
jgi:hypothetical protein